MKDDIGFQPLLDDDDDDDAPAVEPLEPTEEPGEGEEGDEEGKDDDEDDDEDKSEKKGAPSGSMEERLLKSRTILIYGEIDMAVAQDVTRRLLVMDADGQIGAASVGYTSEMGMRLRWWWVKWTRRS